MRILVINGIHGKVERLEALLGSMHGRRAEAIFVLGDIARSSARQQARHEPRRSAELKPVITQELKDQAHTYTQAIEILARANVPIFIIPGEYDAPLAQLSHALETYRDSEHMHLVHRHAAALDAETVVAGFGGKLEGTTHADPWLLHFPDWEVRLAFEHLKTFVPRFQLAQQRVFLFGTPLRGRSIDLRAGQHTGVESLNVVNRAYQPLLICCAGPDHSRGIETVDGALVVNPGSLAEGSYAFVRLEGAKVDAELHWLHTPLKLRTLVVAFDGSEEAWSALDLVPTLASVNNPVVVLVHAFEPVHQSLGHPYDEAILAERMAAGEQLLQQAASALQGVRVECELVEGPASDAIVRIAAHRNANLILMGSRGLGRIRGLLGSVSQHVLQHAPCPVLVAPGVVYQPDYQPDVGNTTAPQEAEPIV